MSAVTSFESSRMFPKAGRMKGLMWRGFAFRKGTSNGRALQPWEEREFQRELLPLLPALSKALAVMLTDLSRSEAEGGTQEGQPGVCDLVVSARSQGHARKTGKEGHEGKTCPQKAPAAHWSNGDQEWLHPEAQGWALWESSPQWGERGTDLLQPHCPPRATAPAARLTSSAGIQKKPEEEVSHYAKQQILVTPPLPITRLKESLF